MAKSFSTWVARSDVEATMGVEVADKNHPGMAWIDAGPSPCSGARGHCSPLPLDVFTSDGRLVGLAFDGDLFLLDEITAQIESFVRENWENPDLVADPCFLRDGSLAGFHVRQLGGSK